MFHQFVLALCGFVLTLTPQSFAQDEEFTIAPDEIGFFRYAGRDHRLFASLRNSDVNGDTPGLWQFRYDPLFLPIARESGSLDTAIDQIGQKWRVRVPIRLYDDAATAAATAALRSLYPAHADSINKNNISALKISRVRFAVPDLQTIAPNATMPSDGVPLFTHDNSIPLDVYTDNEASAKALERVLPKLRIDYSVAFAAAVAKRNAVRVTYEDLRNSALRAQLEGGDTRATYVHRDDVRQLTEGIHRSLEYQGTIEAPDKFDAELFSEILRRLTSLEPTSGFTNEQWAATYNSDDLRPDVIEKELNKLFVYDEREHQWKKSGGFSSSGKAGIMKFLSAEASLSGNFSAEDLQRVLTQHEVETEFSGTKIVVKGVGVRRVNSAAFNGSGEFTHILAYVDRKGLSRDGSVDFGLLFRDAAYYPDLVSRVGNLEQVAAALRSTMFIPGEVRVWLGNRDEAQLKVLRKQGWLECDGTRVSRDEYPQLYAVLHDRYGPSTDGFFGLPDLRDRVPMGASKSGANAEPQSDGDPESQGSELPAGGSATHKLLKEELPPHRHLFDHHSFESIVAAAGAQGQPGANIRTGGNGYSLVKMIAESPDLEGRTFSIVNPYFAATYLIYAGSGGTERQ